MGHVESHEITITLVDAAGFDFADFILDKPGTFLGVSITPSGLISNDNIQAVGCIDIRGQVPSISPLVIGSPISTLRVLSHKQAGTAGNSPLILIVTIWVRDV